MSKMTSIELRAATSLASILSLRMLALLMVLPLFSLYATQLHGATPFLIGMALGIYGLTQALFQLPFGMLSDRLGRRKIITFGLLLFALGSAIAALSHTISGMIIGRALQGTGAVGSTLMAMIADLTRPEQRTKAMAIAGVSIGAALMLAMMLGPILANWLSVPGLFWLAVCCSFFAIFLLFTWTPKPPTTPWQPNSTESFLSLLKDKQLAQLNLGILLLHTIFTASFVVIPIGLAELADLPGAIQWRLYLPILILAFIFSMICILIAERKQRTRFFFVGAIMVLSVAEFILWLGSSSLVLSSVSLLLFLTAFSLLEAFLPSIVSLHAPPERRGAALGLYSCSQFLGIFLGGLAGGWLYGQLGLTYVYLFCVILAVLWGTMSINMKIGDITHGKRH